MVTLGQGAGYVLDYTYLKKKKFISTDLSKQQAIHTDPKSIQQITFTRHLN